LTRTTTVTVTANPEPPAAPTNLVATATSNNQINLTWTDNATTPNNESGFKIERCQGSGCTNFAQIATVGENATSYSNSGLASSTTYRYRVVAYNTGGDSAYSNEASATTAAGPSAPAAPSGLTATALSRSVIELVWKDNSSNESGFKIERKTGSAGSWSQIKKVGSNVTSYKDRNRSANTTYYYRVRAYNSIGDSPYSAEATATTPRSTGDDSVPSTTTQGTRTSTSSTQETTLTPTPTTQNTTSTR
jgi:hypothetical protein